MKNVKNNIKTEIRKIKLVTSPKNSFRLKKNRKK